MGIEPDTASLPLRVDTIDYMIHWVLEPSTKRRIFPRQAIKKHILDVKNLRYVNPYNNSNVSIHEAIHMKFIGATEYGSQSDSITVQINGQSYVIKWVYDTRNMKKFLPREALKLGLLDIQLNEYRKFDTNDIMTILDAIQAGYIKCTDDDSSSEGSIKPPSIISIDEDELTIATKTATYVITSVIHPVTQKEIKVSEAIELGILDKETGSYRDLNTNVTYELAEAINEGLVYATIIETKEDTEMSTSSLQEIIKKFIVKSVAIDSESTEKIGGLEAQAVGILNYAQGVYHDRKFGVKIPLDKAIEKKLLDVELVSQKKFEEYDLELITDTITEKRITLYKIHGVRNNVLDRMESGAVAVKGQMIDTEAKTYTDFSTGESMSIQEAVNRNLIQAKISEHVERKPLGLSMQNAIRLGFYTAETGTFRDPATEQYLTLSEAIDHGHIHPNGVAFADSERGPINLYEAISLGLCNVREGGKLNSAKIKLFNAKLVEPKLHRMNVEDAIRCGLLNLRTGLYKHPHSGEQLSLKEAIQRGLIDGQSTVIEHPSNGQYMTLKQALEGTRIDQEGQVVDLYSQKIITTLELAFNHRKLFSMFDVNAGEIFIPSQNESIGFEKAIRKNLLDNKIKLFDPKTNKEYTIQDAIERGLVDHESGLIYDPRSRQQYSIREAIRHGLIAVVGAPLVPIKADHETVAAKITSRKHRRHSLAKSSLHYDYNSAPDSADEDSLSAGGHGWHKVKPTRQHKSRDNSPFSGTRRRTGSSPSAAERSKLSKFSTTCRDDDWTTPKRFDRRDDDDEDDYFSRRHFHTAVGDDTFVSSSSRTQSGGGTVTTQQKRNFNAQQQHLATTPVSSQKNIDELTHLIDNQTVEKLTERIVNETTESSSQPSLRKDTSQRYVNNENQRDVPSQHLKEDQEVTWTSSTDDNVRYKLLTEQAPISQISKQPEQQSKTDNEERSTILSLSNEDEKLTRKDDDELEHGFTIENKSEQEEVSSSSLSLLPQQSPTISTDQETPVVGNVKNEEEGDKINDSVQWRDHTPPVSTSFKRTSSERQSVNRTTFQNEQMKNKRMYHSKSDSSLNKSSTIKKTKKSISLSFDELNKRTIDNEFRIKLTEKHNYEPQATFRELEELVNSFDLNKNYVIDTDGFIRNKEDHLVFTLTQAIDYGIIRLTNDTKTTIKRDESPNISRTASSVISRQSSRSKHSTISFRLQEVDVDDIIDEMKNAIQRLSSFQLQINKYAYINENIDELKSNIEFIKAIREDIHQEKSLINSLLNRSNSFYAYSKINDQDNGDLELLANDLKEKWENVRTTSGNLVERLDDY
ncbi:unnamed protein product, partial [Didymodactylos carnosus]